MRDLLITSPSSKHLWRSIRKGPKEARCCGEVGLSHDARQANIPNLGHGVILVEKDILGLQITVDHLHMDAQEVVPQWSIPGVRL